MSGFFYAHKPNTELMTDCVGELKCSPFPLLAVSLISHWSIALQLDLKPIVLNSTKVTINVYLLLGCASAQRFTPC
jgi:hypothetical protein